MKYNKMEFLKNETFCTSSLIPLSVICTVTWYAIERESEGEVNKLTPIYLNQQVLRKIG